MNADRAAGSRPGSLPLPPALTTRNVFLGATPERVPLPPFHGSLSTLNGVAPALAVEPVVEDVRPVEAATEIPVPEPVEPPALEVDAPILQADTPTLEADGPAVQVDAPALEAEPELSGWFTNGLADVSLAEEGVEVDVSAGEPVYQTDTSIPAELVFGAEGTVEPVFEEDVHAMEEMLAESASSNADFPLDAFIIPEEAERLPTGLAQPPEPKSDTERGAAGEIAARFEHISKLLREEDVNELLRRLARGDKLDALLAGLLAGYLATHDA